MPNAFGQGCKSVPPCKILQFKYWLQQLQKATEKVIPAVNQKPSSIKFSRLPQVLKTTDGELVSLINTKANLVNT